MPMYLIKSSYHKYFVNLSGGVIRAIARSYILWLFPIVYVKLKKHNKINDTNYKITIPKSLFYLIRLFKTLLNYIK
jgi:hypothetical protein